jgi:methionine-rich copper-binding protein CopC
MVASQLHRRSTRRRGRRLALRLNLEVLETRMLPSVTWPGFLSPVAETEPNGTLDQAQNLGDLTTSPRAEVVGTITNNAGGGGVDWYSFQLDRAADVVISTPKAQPASPPVTTISLYNSDPNDFNDPYDPLGYRLLAQSDSATASGTAQIDRKLAPGTYYVAVSGSGNDYFFPFLADSGYAGATGNYGLLITATDLGLTATDGPAVLAADPQAGANLLSSPFMIRVDLSKPLDPNTVSAGGTVRLLTNPSGSFGNGNDQPVSLASVNLNTAGNELLIAPAAPLPPGYYEVVLAGNSSTDPQVLADLNGTPLGTDSSHPSGTDFSYTFQISGNEGVPVIGSSSAATADDTPATSHQLGDITNAGLVQVAGAIGDDSTDPLGFDGSDVDLYHFQVSGTGRYALTAEVFAGRIGSPLSPGLSLFQVNPTTGQLILLASNTGTQNPSSATDGLQPLSLDPALLAGLEPGDYYLAVSNSLNVPDPVNSPPGTNGVFDPNVSHSGQNGGSTGNYVLNLLVQPTTQEPPKVVAVTPAEGSTLNAPPTQLTVQFSEPVNLPQLALEERMQGVVNTCAAVYVEGSNGSKYYPILESYDSSTNTATFQMLDSLATDSYRLHLAASLGLAGLGGSLVGNDPSGDYVTSFTVNAPARGTGNNPLLWMDQEPNNNLGQAQNLGVLFPNDLLNGVTLERDFSQDPSSAPADTADYYRFQILDSGNYVFGFGTSSLPAGAKATLLDITGAPVQEFPQPRGLGFSANLQPGIYFLDIGGWNTGQAAGVKYTVVITSYGFTDNPVPLTTGPAPAISLQPVSDVPPSPPPQPVVVSLPITSSPIVTSTATTFTPANTTSVSTATNTTPLSTTSSAPSSATDASSTPAPSVSPTVVLAAATAPASPPVSSPSAALLVNLLVPTTVNSAALLSSTPRGTPNRPAESINLPAGVLLALGAGPVGGIKDAAPTDPSPSADHVFVRLPEWSARQLQPGTAMLARIESGADKGDLPATEQSPNLETTGEESTNPFEEGQENSVRWPNTAPELALPMLVSDSIGELVSHTYEGARDAFFRIAQWRLVLGLGPDAAPQPQPSGMPKSVSLPPAISTEIEPQTEDRAGSATGLDTARAPNVTDTILAIGLAAVTAMAVASPGANPDRGRGRVVRWRGER